MNTEKLTAVIYTRVSSKSQLADGHGNDAQEHICRKFASEKGYTILSVFQEPGISGAKTDRPAMRKMISFLQERKEQREKTAVIIDDLKRFSREVGGYWELKQLIGDCDAQLISPKHDFSETPEGKFIQTMLVASGQLEREQNARQVVDKMKARLERGYWTFPDTLPGLKFVKEPEHGKVMRRKEPEASIVAEALEGYASGRFDTQADVMRFLAERRFYREPRIEHVSRLLNRAIFYAGYLEYPKWNVQRVKGKHDALISLATYERIQERLKATVGTHDRIYHRPEFPLRGYVRCVCGGKLTAGHSRGRSSSYPYYYCFRKDCAFYGKAVRAQKLEEDFTALLRDITPTKKMLALSKANLQKRWEERLENLSVYQESLRQKDAEIGRQVEQLATRAASTTSTAAARAYEARIEALEKDRVAVRQELRRYVDEQIDFRTALEQVTDYLSKPVLRWESGDLATRQTLIRLCFTKNPVYYKATGFRTDGLSLTYAIITGRKALENVDGGPGGS
ncbi:MAG: resolvase-like protein [Parcubacteria group bacterium Gr01-1014_38]|nr:MAG: resolvase-like protein [Parcubacteria group bacterium Gr01-1014_38]